ncbi:MAG: aspartyl/asparaginyl beta-hydroxylase domain-containing protein [Leptolyngbyaceae cyanobacterium]
MIRILLRAWELIAWIQVFQEFTSIISTQLLRRPPTATPEQSFEPYQTFSITDASLYPVTKPAFVDLLEANSHLILAELEQLTINRFTSWGEQYPDQTGWHTFSFYTYGLKLENNCRSCLATAQLLDNVPNLVTARFAVLTPGTYLTRQSTQPNGLLCCHLGLMIPEQCGIQIAHMQQTWHQGKCLIFDNAVEHTVWNWNDDVHAVLSIEFKASQELFEHNTS